MCGGDWEISHGGARTPELQCKTYEELLLDAAAKSVGCTKSALPKIAGYSVSDFGKVPKRVEGKFVPNPDYDEEEFKALSKQEQTSKR